MHIAAALNGVAENDRCPNWKKGAAAGCAESTKNGDGGLCKAIA